MNTTIETYLPETEGYHPFLIREGWQVARLNYMPAQNKTAISRMEKHQQTDEVFCLLQGQAILIAERLENDERSFDCLLMESGVTYNIPRGTWHNIAMEPGTAVMIVEKSYTHRNDCIYRDLNPEELHALRTQMNQVIS